MIARGNAKTKWWTCQLCLSRWAKLAPGEVTAQTRMPQDQDLVIFGKYTGSNYLETFQDATYCNWIMDTVENESGMMKTETSEQFQRLAQYIHLRWEAETWEGHRFRPGHVHLMLAAMPLGVIAHVALAGSTIPNLEGPVFGKRVGTYPLHELGKIQFNRENAIRESKGAPFRLSLYRPPCGAVEHSNAEDHSAPFESVGTEPSAVKRLLLKVAQVPDAWMPPATDKEGCPEWADVWNKPATDTKAFPLSTSAELPPMPEDQPAWNLPPVGPSEDDQVLPGEVPQEEADMDAAPLSDDELEAPRADFHPARQQLIDFKIAHHNSGHPSPADFARMIKLGNGKPDLVRWVKHH